MAKKNKYLRRKRKLHSKRRKKKKMLVNNQIEQILNHPAYENKLSKQDIKSKENRKIANVVINVLNVLQETRKKELENAA